MSTQHDNTTSQQQTTSSHATTSQSMLQQHANPINGSETDVEMTENSSQSQSQSNTNEHPNQTTNLQQNQPNQTGALDPAQVFGSSQHLQQGQVGQITGLQYQDTQTSGAQSGSSSLQNPQGSQDQHHVTKEVDEELVVEDSDDDADDDGDDEGDKGDDIDTKIEKRIRRQRRFKLKTLFGNGKDECVFPPAHKLYTDVIVGILKPQDCPEDQWLQQSQKKTLEEVFESLGKQQREGFLSQYTRDASSLQNAIYQQQRSDYAKQKALVYFDMDHLRNNRWLQKGELQWLQTPEGSDEALRKAAKCAKIAATFGVQKFRDPLNRDPQGNVHIMRDQENEPIAPYLAHIFKAFDDYMEQCLEEEASHMVYWCERPTGISDEDWLALKQSKKESYGSQQKQRQYERREALPAEVRQKELEEEAKELVKQRREATERESALKDAESRLQTRIQEQDHVKPINQNVPAAAKTEYLAVLPTIMNWWENDKNKDDDSQFTSVNLRLTSALGAAQAVPFHLKFSLLYSQITDIRKVLTTCEELDGEAYDSKISELGSFVICLTNELRNIGLDWKMVAPTETHVRILTLLRQSQIPDVRKRRTAFENAWLEPSQDQMKILQDAKFGTMHLMFGIENDNDDILRISLESMRSINARLKVANLKSGIRSSDHNVPTAELEAAANSMPTAEDKRELILTFLLKWTFLGIPGSKEFEKLSFTCTEERKEEILKEVLGLKQVVLPGEMAYDVPVLGTGPAESSRFSNCAHQKTVGWGENSRSRFYINQYGPRNAPIWRKERYPTPEWLTKWSEDCPPFSQKVSNSMNRMGSIKNSQGGWKYGKSHLKVILGVAWDEEKVSASDYDDAIESLNPIYHDKSRDTFKGHFDSVYILVGWDRDNDGILTYRWEIRETVRRTYGKKDADTSIYKYAKVSEARFDEWSGGRLASSSRSPSPLVLGVVPTNQRHASPVTSVDTSHRRGIFDYSFPASPPTSGDSRSPTLSVTDSSTRVRPTTEASEDVEKAYDRIQHKYPGNTLKQNDVMELKFGKGWAQFL
ncbi:hypothetical protein EK21DRAFT_113331 [Setomelanomma holmii]|uniref:Uncharacterized protein n=1 Tax=Setomelanomma holmii TaxID=210430 RepID=A0A9P4LMG8_9PLEO|nr:hypothetical protein EK21DRAFT_113331 [Setomelanomma holmii]